MWRVRLKIQYLVLPRKCLLHKPVDRTSLPGGNRWTEPMMLVKCVWPALSRLSCEDTRANDPAACSHPTWQSVRHPRNSSCCVSLNQSKDVRDGESVNVIEFVSCLHTHSSNLFRKKLHQRSAVWIITHPLREENGWIFLNKSVFYLIVLNVHKASLYSCLFRKTKWRTWHEEIDSLWMLQLKGLYFTAIVFLQSRVHVNECRNYQRETFFEFRVEGVS